jgi:hypothetical protein
MTRFAALALAALTTGSAVARAQGAYEIYPRAALAQDQSRFEQRLRAIFARGLWDFMDGAEKEALAGVHLKFPPIGLHRNPFDFYSYLDGGRPTVDLPVLSLKFIEDLSTAYAWRHLHGYTLEPVDEYIAMLKYRAPGDFPGGRYPDPLTALGVPAGVLEQEPEVDDLSLRFRNSAWAFILAHELGHLRHRHASNATVDPATSQAHEVEADRFAFDLLSRSDTIPMGMILWFQASVGFFPNRADFKTERQFLDWQRREATHPMNPGRLQALALQLDRAANRTLSRSHAEVLRFIATRLASIGDILAEPDMQRLVARQAVLGDPADLRRR